VTKAQEAESMKATPESIPEGSHVHLFTNGQHIGSGDIDTWMPDGSAFWIWLDHGGGKRLVHESDTVKVLISDTGSDVPSQQA
jgi:hypothetical protein